MRRYPAAFLALAALILPGCAHGPVETPHPGHVTGVRTDLTGVDDPAIRALVELDVQEGKVFLYASEQTDSPVVEKQDVAFALQFKTAPVYGGFRQAALFNRYMLAYLRARLAQGLCPDHPGAELREETVKGRRRLHPGRRIAPRKVLVCPVDNRNYSLSPR